MLVSEFSIGDTVYLITDNEQSAGLLTRIMFSPNQVEYEIAIGATKSWHYGFELSKERDLVKVFNNTSKED